jgi:hypothetical protein
MAISPIEALKPTEEDLAKITDLEKIIDFNIKHHFDGKSLKIKHNIQVNHRIIRELEARYYDAGWGWINVTPKTVEVHLYLNSNCW